MAEGTGQGVEHVLAQVWDDAYLAGVDDQKRWTDVTTGEWTGATPNPYKDPPEGGWDLELLAEVLAWHRQSFHKGQEDGMCCASAVLTSSWFAEVKLDVRTEALLPLRRMAAACDHRADIWEKRDENGEAVRDEEIQELRQIAAKLREVAAPQAEPVQAPGQATEGNPDE